MEKEEVYMSNRNINLNKTDLRTTIRIMMAEAGTESMKEIAENLKINETTFRSSVNNDAMRLRDFLKVAESMGYEVIVRSKE